MDIQSAIKDLSRQSYFIWDGFLNAEESQLVLNDLHQSEVSGSFKLSGTGNKNGNRVIRKDVRNDQTHWLDAELLTPAQELFWQRLDQLKCSINEKLFMGLWDLTGHYSHYPVGGFYVKHLDRFYGFVS